VAARGQIRVVSVSESDPIDIAFSLGWAPANRDAPGPLSVTVVPAACAFPGYGATATAPRSDHVTVSKPDSPREVRYTATRDLVVEAVRGWGR